MAEGVAQAAQTPNRALECRDRAGIHQVHERRSRLASGIVQGASSIATPVSQLLTVLNGSTEVWGPL